MRANDYWHNRAIDNALSQWKKTGHAEKELDALFVQYLDDIKKDVAAFYANHAKNGEVDAQVAQALLNKSEQIKSSRSVTSLLGSIKDSDNPRVQAEIAKIRATTPLNRMEDLMLSVSAKSLELAEAQERVIEGNLKEVFSDTYYRTQYELAMKARKAGSFSVIPTDAILAAISMPYKGTYFSQAIWDNREVLIKKLRQTMTEGLTKGYSYQKMAKGLADEVNSAYKASLRVVRTETNKVMSEGALQGYKRSGVVKAVQFTATLDSRTSETCRTHDLNIIKLEDCKIGVNVPPLHPNCRSTVYPYFEDQPEGTRESKTGKVSKDMTYEQWLSSLG